LKQSNKKPPGVDLVTLVSPGDPVAEGYRAMRTNLFFSSVDERLQTIVVTSSIPGEGKTTIASNLAVAMAQAGNCVLLVDADFRRPDVHKVFHRSNVGLANLIVGDTNEEELIQPTQVANLRVVCCGPDPPNPSELLGSRTMKSLIGRFNQVADVVIFDTPPIGAFTDAAILAALTDGAILVVEQGRTDISAVERSRDTLLGVNARVLGVALNKVKNGKSSEYYYGYYGVRPSSNGGTLAGSKRGVFGPVSTADGRPLAPAVAGRDSATAAPSAERVARGQDPAQEQVPAGPGDEVRADGR
jgi:capsular exopolysaccharide synthesis family protein